MDSSESLGLVTLIPAVFSIILAFVTKNVVISLFIGTISGTFILQLSNTNVIGAFFSAYKDITIRIVSELSNEWNAGIILQVSIIGGLIFLISKMGGTKAIALALSKRAKTDRSIQLTTWFLSLVIFFDDYAGLLLVGPTMRTVYSKAKIAKEKLAFIIDSTAAPVAGIALISTWIGLEISLINTAYNEANIMPENMDGFGIFLRTVPYRFYNILMIIFVAILAITSRDFGPMLKAQRLVKKEEANILDTGLKIDNEYEPDENIKLSIWNAIIPIGVLIIGSLITFYIDGYINILKTADEYTVSIIRKYPFSFKSLQNAFSYTNPSIAMFQSALLAFIVTFIMGICKKIFTVEKGIEYLLSGVKTMIITVVTLILAWSLGSVINDLGTAVYLSEILGDKIPMFLLPSMIFILGAIISFSIGSSFGTMGILMPLSIPLAIAIQPNQDMLNFEFILACTSAVLTGAIFGDHCSPISDTTILASMGADCDPIDHVKTQTPYALLVFVVTIIFGYIPAGLGVHPITSIIISLIILLGAVYLLGKKVTS